jgi:TorA maturation chaperone TorD
MMTDPAKADAPRVQEALAKIPHPQPVARRFGRDVYEPAQLAWQEADPLVLEAEYDRLFRRNLACPPHETAYGDGRRMGGRPAELADIRGFYEAFGVVPSSTDPELPDHLATELEFYSILLLKIAYARVGATPQDVEVTAAAAGAFLEHHLGRWPGAFREAVEAENAASPYLETAHLIEAVIAEECRRVGARPRTVEGIAPQDSIATADDMVCPMAGDCGKRAGM